MKKVFLILSIALMALCAGAQNTRIAVKSVMDLATTTKTYYSNRDSMVGLVKLGTDSTQQNVKVLTFQIFVFKDTTTFKTFQDNLFAQSKTQEEQAERLRLQAIAIKAEAKQTQIDVADDITKRPAGKTAVVPQGLMIETPPPTKKKQ